MASQEAISSSFFFLNLEIDNAIRYYENDAVGQNIERVQKALAEMGISMFSGCLTTSSAAIALLFTQIYAFFHFGIFLIWLIPGAFIMSISCLPALLCAIGPNEGEGLIPVLGKIIMARSNK